MKGKFECSPLANLCFCARELEHGRVRDRVAAAPIEVERTRVPLRRIHIRVKQVFRKMRGTGSHFNGVVGAKGRAITARVYKASATIVYNLNASVRLPIASSNLTCGE